MASRKPRMHVEMKLRQWGGGVKSVKVPLVRSLGRNARTYISIKNPDVISKAQANAIRASQNLMVRLDQLVAKRSISLKDYLARRVQVEQKLAHSLHVKQAQIKRILDRDPLITTLFSRAKFMREAEYMLRGNKACSFVMLDVDFFKKINDSLGHPAGDAALVFFGNVINRTIRKMGGVAGRYGGEEITAMIPGGPRKVVEFIERLNQELVDAFAREDSIRSILKGELFTFSAGAAARVEGKSLEDLKALADERLYASKKAGRNALTATSDWYGRTMRTRTGGTETRQIRSGRDGSGTLLH